MRLNRQTVTVRSGAVLICDPDLVRGCAPAGSATFQLWEGNGDFVVYGLDDAYFVDIDPRIFQAKTRPGLRELPGRVGIDSSYVGIYDLTSGCRHAAADALADGRAIEIGDLVNGDYVAWFEEKGSSQKIYRGVIGFGSKPVLLLNGGHAGQLQEAEDRIARAYRLKGADKQAELQAIATILCDLHLDGCKDARLKMMATSIKLKLPRRTAKKRT